MVRIILRRPIEVFSQQYLIILSLVLLTQVACKRDNCITLEEQDKYRDLEISIIDKSEICLDVSNLPEFNFAHVSTGSRFYIVDKDKSQNNLLLSRQFCQSADTIEGFTSFEPNDTITLILGNRMNKAELSMSSVFAVRLTINEKK